MPRSSRSSSSRPSHRYAARLPTRSRSPARSRPRSRSRSRSRSDSHRPPPTAPSTHTLRPPSAPSSHTINRQLTTPFLLHLCYRSNAFHNLADFPVPIALSSTNAASSAYSRPSHLPAHLQIYTWMSCTLRELAQLLTTALPGIMPRPGAGTRLAFRLVYPDTSPVKAGRLGPDGAEEARGRYVSREMGSVVVGASSVSADAGDEAQEQARGNGNARQTWDLGGDDAFKTLEDVRFVIGDFVDCAVFPPLSDGSVVARSTVLGYGNGLGGGAGRRELNGFGRASSRGGGGGGYGRGRAGFGSGAGGGESLPSGEWRRGERLPDRGSSGGGSGGYGRPRGRH